MWSPSAWLLFGFLEFLPTEGNSDGRHLYDRLMHGYNPLVRPVESDSSPLNVSLGIKLTQLIDVDEPKQVVVTNIWLRQEWIDYRLKWDPAEYGGILSMQILSDTLWTPDIVLYNNADGDYEIIHKTRARVYHTGDVVWEPPAIYKSYCLIEVKYFPYDKQICKLKFGTWSYDGFKINLIPLRGYVDDNITISNGIDLSEYYLSIEWDIMAVTAIRNRVTYSCCEEPYLDITYTIAIRRKTLYFTVNMIMPCVAVSFLTVLVFYLPSDSGEKITLSISVLMSLTVFFLMLAENVPPTSLAVPLIGKYLVFTMVLVTLSTMITVAVLDVHFRNPSTHYKMSPWVRRVFIDILPRIIRVQRPKEYAPKFEYKTRVEKERERFVKRSQYSKVPFGSDHEELSMASYSYDDTLEHTGDFSLQYSYTPEVERAIEGLKFIADRYRDSKEQENNIQDWKYVARVIDRFFLWTFGTGVIIGTLAVILDAPSLYDHGKPIPFKCFNSSLVGADKFAYPADPSNNVNDSFLCSTLM